VYGNFSELTDKEFQRYVKPYLLSFSETNLIHLDPTLYKNSRQTVLRVRKKTDYVSGLNPHYILVSNDTDLSITTNGKTKPLVIADCSNSYNFVKKLKKQCKILDLPFYWIRERGALHINI
jgi:hypothetical protein